MNYGRTGISAYGRPSLLQGIPSGMGNVFGTQTSAQNIPTSRPETKDPFSTTFFEGFITANIQAITEKSQRSKPMYDPHTNIYKGDYVTIHKYTTETKLIPETHIWTIGYTNHRLRAKWLSTMRSGLNIPSSVASRITEIKNNYPGRGWENYIYEDLFVKRPLESMKQFQRNKSNIVHDFKYISAEYLWETIKPFGVIFGENDIQRTNKKNFSAIVKGRSEDLKNIWGPVAVGDTLGIMAARANQGKNPEDPLQLIPWYSGAANTIENNEIALETNPYDLPYAGDTGAGNFPTLQQRKYYDTSGCIQYAPVWIIGTVIDTGPASFSRHHARILAGFDKTIPDMHKYSKNYKQSRLVVNMATASYNQLFR